MKIFRDKSPIINGSRQPGIILLSGFRIFDLPWNSVLITSPSKPVSTWEFHTFLSRGEKLVSMDTKKLLQVLEGGSYLKSSPITYVSTYVSECAISVLRLSTFSEFPFRFQMKSAQIEEFWFASSASWIRQCIPIQAFSVLPCLFRGGEPWQFIFGWVITNQRRKNLPQPLVPSYCDVAQDLLTRPSRPFLSFFCRSIAVMWFMWFGAGPNWQLFCYLIHVSQSQTHLPYVKCPENYCPTDVMNL